MIKKLITKFCIKFQNRLTYWIYTQIVTRPIYRKLNRLYNDKQQQFNTRSNYHE